MPRKCVICKAYDRNSDKSFYSFPKDEGHKKLWLKACGIDLCLPSYRVCDAHFLEKDFLPNNSLNRIAIPKDNSMQQEPPVPTNIVFESSYQETLPSDTVIHQQTNSICVTSKKLGCNELPDVSTIQKRKRYNPDTIEDLSPSHFDTPRKAKRNLEMIKCKFEQKRTQNANLKKQVQRLQVKLRTYNDLILHMKNKNR